MDRWDPRCGSSRRTVLQGAVGVRVASASARGRPAGLLRHPEGTKQTPESVPEHGPVRHEKELIFSNWPQYIDPTARRYRRPSTTSRRRPASRSPTPRTSTTTTSSSPRSSNQLGACEPIGRDMFVLTDWMAARMIRLGWIQKLDQANIPNVDANLLDQPQDARVGPGPRVLRAVAERLDRHRLQPEGHRRGRELRRAAHPRGPQGQGHAAHRDARHDGLHAQSSATTRPTSPTTTSTPRIDTLRRPTTPARSARSPATTTPDDLDAGNIAACMAWTGDVIQLQADNPDIKFVAPEEGLVAVVATTC